jgi:ferredoxin
MPCTPGHDGERRRIAVVYHSAAGGTAVVARLLAELLCTAHDARAASIEDPAAAGEITAADFTVLCYPTYFLKPSWSMRDFIAGLGRLPCQRPAYLVTTYELYTENSLRACARALKGTGLAVTGSAAVRSPGSDLTCVFPDWACGWLFRFGRGMPRKLLAIAREVDALAGRGGPERIPAWKLYSLPAQVVQRAFFDSFINWRERLRILPERCTDCGACVTGCARGAWRREDGAIRLHAERCELCTRCIHRCPQKAIVLMRSLRDNRRLDKRCYAELEARAREMLGLPPHEGAPA